MARFDVFAVRHPVLAWAVIWSPVALLTLLLTACGTVSPETVTVRVPVAVKPAPPAELTAALATDRLPVFVPPDDPRATSGLTAEGERALQQLLLELLTRTRAWAAWAHSED